MTRLRLRPEPEPWRRLSGFWFVCLRRSTPRLFRAQRGPIIYLRLILATPVPVHVCVCAHVGWWVRSVSASTLVCVKVTSKLGAFTEHKCHICTHLFLTVYPPWYLSTRHLSQPKTGQKFTIMTAGRLDPQGTYLEECQPLIILPGIWSICNLISALLTTHS